MGLESATFISNLNTSNPGSTDLESQGDDHLRLIKSVLQNTFPDASRAKYFGTMKALQTDDLDITAPSDSESTFPFNCAADSYTASLPGSGLFDGFAVRIIKADFGPNTVTIDAGDSTVNGQSSIKLEKGYQSAYVIYSDTLAAWLAQVDPITPTGAFLDTGKSTAPSGFVACDGSTTVGDSSSGATLASATAEALFVHLWGSYTNTTCPVSSGRGSSAAADWAAHKKITMPELASKFRLTSDSAAGSTGGASTITLAKANLPSYNLTGSAASVSDHRHLTLRNTQITTSDTTAIASTTHAAANKYNSGGSDFSSTIKDSGSTEANVAATSADGGHSHSVTVASGGSGTAFSILPPYFTVHTYMAL